MSKKRVQFQDMVSDQEEMDKLIQEFRHTDDEEEPVAETEDSVPEKKVKKKVKGKGEDFDPLSEFFARAEDSNLDFTVLDIDSRNETGKVTIFDKRRHDFLGFELADEHYAINIMRIKEIIKYREITEVPRSPIFLPGIISLRGEVIPIVDLRKRLKLEAHDLTRNARILVVEFDGESFGLIVNRVTAVSRIVEKDIEPPPSVIGGIEAKFIEGVGKLDKGVLIILNVDAVLRFALEEI